MIKIQLSDIKSNLVFDFEEVDRWLKVWLQSVLDRGARKKRQFWRDVTDHVEEYM